MSDTTKKEEYFKFLDELRETGITNMFGAGPYLEDAYPELNRQEAKAVVREWMGRSYR